MYIVLFSPTRRISVKKLIIWDFDGVIADTESISTGKYVEFAKEYNIILTRDDVIKYLVGKGELKQLEVLQSLGKDVNAEIVKQINDNISKVVNQNISLTENIEDIFKLKEFDQCIATGNSLVGIKARFDPLSLERYFSKDTVFSADFVAQGKPEPDLFLYAAKKMNYEPKDCIVIEDSIYGIMAGLKANMTVIAYLEHVLYDKEAYVKKINSLGNIHICKILLNILLN